MENVKPTTHTLTLENKKRALITGVSEVISATEQGVYVKLTDGALQLQGEALRVEKLSPEERLLIVAGNVFTVKYSGAGQKSLFKRLFK